MEITSRLGFKVKAPSPKTTWLLIYVILGFLAVLSVLFFLRWYHRTGNE
jgi:cytoskeletal protein RodZ